MFARDLKQAIESGRPISVADYMARCNAHYYGTRDPLGAAGDFTTAPEISQIFGELIGAWIAQAWGSMGEIPAVLCELGPGRGTLMRDMLRVTRNIAGFHDALDILLVETSPVLQQRQRETLSQSHPRIHWAENLNSLPPKPLLLVANEFFDALPVRQFVKDGLTEKERHITCDGETLRFTPEGPVLREDSPDSATIMANIAGHIRKHGGAALIIDYGYAQGELGDTLQAMRSHTFTDPLADPGEADLTAHVDFAGLAAVAQNCGAHAHGPVAQGTFLKRLGAELRATALCRSANTQQQTNILSGLERLVAPHQMGELFKVLCVTSSLERPAGF